MTDANISIVAGLIAEPARTAILTALLDGRAAPAGELAFAANISPATASSHLSKLLDGGLLSVESEGRHRYYRLAGPHVAEAMERLAAISPVGEIRRKALTRRQIELGFARRCYDHLAGRLAVTLAEALQSQGFLRPGANKTFELTSAGSAWFAEIGVDLQELRRAPRGAARQCLDWTERRHHVAGPLGAALLRRFCERRWLTPCPHSRKIEITPAGRMRLLETLGIDADRLAPPRR